MKIKKGFLIICSTLFLLTGCGQKHGTPIDDQEEIPEVTPVDNTKVKSIAFSQSTYSLKVGESLDLVVTVSPSTALNKNSKYSIIGNDEKIIASLDSNRVTGVSEGQVTIVASSVENNSIQTTATLNVEKSSDEEKTFNPYLITSESEVFTLEDQKYIASGEYSYKIFSTNFSEGLISLNISHLLSTKEAGIIFGYNPLNNTYFRININKNSKLSLCYFNGENLVEIKEFNNFTSQISSKIELKVFPKYRSINISLNKNDEIEYNVDLPENGYFGIYAESGGTIFSELKMNKNPYFEDYKKDHFKVAHGTAVVDDNKITIKSPSTLVMSDKKLFDGVFEFTYCATGNNSLVGCVFCANSNGREKFWSEPDVSYYRLGVGITGSLNLYKVEGSKTTLLRYFISYMYDDSIEHTIKVVKNGQVFDFYLDGIYQMSHRDENVLTGSGIGVFDAYESGYFKNIKINNVNYISSSNLPDMRICNGSFESTYDAIRSTSKNSLCLMNDEMTSREGSIVTTIGGGTSKETAETITYKFGYGVVFNVTTPNMKNFYESQTGLSYYCFWNDGDQYFRLGRFEGSKVVWTTKRYVAQSIEHSGNVRVVVKGNDIYCYYLNRLIVKYHDDNPLKGTKYGFKASDIDAVFVGGITYSENTSIDKADYLIFGHSYTHLWLNYKKDFAELGDSVFNVGIGGANTRHFKEYIKEIASYGSKWGIYWNGINDINSGQIQPTEMAQNVKTVMEGIKAINPDFHCVFVGINFCTHGKSCDNRNLIIEANSLYKEMCDTLDYVKFLDVQELYSDKDGQPIKSYFIDDLHPTKEAYQMVAPLIIDLINEK